VLFGEADSEPLLGAFSLKSFLLVADPVRQRLVPVPGLLKPLAAAGVVSSALTPRATEPHGV
jgi:hypothetical protein